VFVDERVREIEQQYAHLVKDLLVLRLTEETLRLFLVLNDGTTLRVAERWHDGLLVRYSYYWLDARNGIKIGWDNSPHHTKLDNFPHHKHIENQTRRIPSYEICLEDVMGVLEGEIGLS